jgi:ATP-binding cassette, subfamily B, bacterial
MTPEEAAGTSALRRSLHKYGRIVRYAMSQRRALFGILILSLALSALAALQPWPLKILVDYALDGARPTGHVADMLSSLRTGVSPGSLVVIAAVAGVVLFIATATFETLITWIWAGVAQRMVYRLANDLFLRLQRLSLLFHARHPVGDSITRITGDAWCVHTVADGVLISPARHVFVLLLIAVVAWRLDPALTLLTLCIAPVLATSAIYFGDRLMRLERLRREAQSHIASFLQQILSAMPLVQAYSAAGHNRLAFATLTGDATRAQRSAALIESSSTAVNSIAMAAGMALVLYGGGQRVIAGAMSLGSLLVFIVYLRTLESASRSLLTTYGKLRAAEASIDRVLEIVDTHEAVHDNPGAHPVVPNAPSRGAYLVFENVTFGYTSADMVLRGLTLELRPGESVALVGATGAGKSTVASLALRFFDPLKGRVLLDGVDLRDITLASLRSQFAVVLQEPFLLPLSVADNIAYGVNNPHREDIIAASVAANAHDFIRALPDGYDTVLGERGSTLSGGERQRLAIARALLKNARVLILDEATSALDSETEHLVAEALDRLMARRTTLVIAHRLSTIRRATCIAVLAHGRIAETGTHDELLRRGSHYARLHSLQAVRSEDSA